MPLTPEDDTGLANADSYVTVADHRTYAADRGIELVRDADTEIEEDLRKAFDYVNSAGPWKAEPLQQTQAGEFPRVDLSDGMGRTWNTVPPQVKQAQHEAAILAGAGVDLFVVAERGGQVQSESVGPISTSYFQGASPDTYFQSIERLLCRFRKSKDSPRRPLPSFNNYDTDPVFSVGMDDNPGQA